MSLAVGARLGPYEILALIGAGGMGEVYRARDTRLDRIVAIKILRSASPELKQRFEREAKAIAALTHSHICTLHDVGHQDGTDYLVMEHLEGRTLADRLKAGPLPFEEARRYGIEIADALDRAHRSGIAHRDLKPANIMVTRSGVKLLDFGLARLRPQPLAMESPSAAPTESTPLTGEGTIVGTLQDMSPEQLQGKDADHRADLWAFGCVVYEMVTGKAAFAGSSPASIIGAILEREPTPLSKIAALAPPLLEQFVARALAKDPEDRWQSARDGRAALEWLRDAREPVAPIRSKRGLSWAVLAASAIAAGLFASLLYVTAPESDKRVVKLSIAPPAGTELDTVSVSPDGRLLAFSATEATGDTRLWVRALDSLEARVFPGTENATFPFWSPDGRYIAYSIGGFIRMVPVGGGPPQTIGESPATRGATWSRTGTVVFAPSSQTPLRRVPSAGGQSTALTKLDAEKPEASHRWPFFLPDGHHYLFTIRSSKADVRGIYVGDVDSSHRTRLLGDLSNAAYATTPSGAGYLVFVRDRSLLAQAFDVTRLQLVGDPIPVADDVWFSPGWSHGAYSVSNNVLVYDTVRRSRDLQPTWFDRTGARQGAIDSFAPASRFSLSLDETRLVQDVLDFQTGRFVIRTIDLARGVSSPITTAQDNAASPLWSPDGSRIVFAASRGIYATRADGAGVEALLFQSDAPVVLQDWSRDGSLLLYMRADAKTRQDLWMLPMDARAEAKPFPFVNGSFNERNGVFSPDGRWVAYESDLSGSEEIYVQAFSRAGAGDRLQVSSGGGVYPQWAQDSSELFYLTRDTRKLMAVSMKSGTTFKVGAPHPLFDLRFTSNRTSAFAVASNGRRFLIPAPVVPPPSSPATVILNWTAALKK